jgi:hypothetical protein
VLRDGVHGGELLALRYRPLRRRAASLLAAPVGPADGRRHGHAQAGARSCSRSTSRCASPSG